MSHFSNASPLCKEQEIIISSLLNKILEDRKVDEEELTAIFKQFDIDGNDQLDADEMRELCKALAALIPGGIDDILQIMDFYQITYDDQFDRAEVRMFLECHVVDNLSTAPS